MIKWFMLTALAVVGVQRCESSDFVHEHEQFDQAVLDGIIAAKDVSGAPPAKEEDVTFYLFTKGSTNFTQFSLDDPTIAANTHGRLYFIIHGWWESRLVQWYTDLTAALLNRDPNSHVVQVDWSGPASTKNYAFGVANTEDVGRIIAKLIHKLIEHHGQPLKDVVIIGHSLGGQITGFTGKNYKELTNRTKRLPRIITLDPAGPIYTDRPDTKRLNKEDADNVINIHTDGGVMGMKNPCGTLDFFPNSGSLQPGCIPLVDMTCSHWRSWGFFIDAVNDLSSFEALKCDSWTAFKLGNCGALQVKETLGNALWTTKIGKFYLKTNAKRPYSRPLDGGVKSILAKFGF